MASSLYWYQVLCFCFLFFQFSNQMYKHSLFESVGKCSIETSPRGFMVYVFLISVI